MKKIICLLSVLLCLYACAKSGSFTVTSITPDNIIIAADNANVQSVGNATIIVNAKQELIIDTNITEGSISIDITKQGADTPVISDVCTGSAVTRHADLNPGYYQVDVRVAEKASGSAVVYTEDLETAEQSGDVQNPVMNVVGKYGSDRCNIEIAAEGADGANVSVSWASSAAETAQWTIKGIFDPENKTITYSDGVMKKVVFNEDGSIASEETLYEDGKGSFVFNEDGTMTWTDEKENIAEGMVFTYAG